MNEENLSYKMIDINNYSELTKDTLMQVHSILQKEASWNDAFSEFKKNYTKSNFKNTKLFLVFSGKEVAGFIEGWVINKDQFYAKSFYVSSKYKNQKIGTKLKLMVFISLRKMSFKKYIDGLVVNPLVNKITNNLMIKRKKLSLNKDSKNKYPFIKRKNDILIKLRKKGRR